MAPFLLVTKSSPPPGGLRKTLRRCPAGVINSPERCPVYLGRETRTSTQSRRLVRRKDASWKIYSGGILAVLLYGCESRCLTAESISRLRNWHNKRIREMCRVTMCQSFVHQISSVSLQKRTGVLSIEHYLASRTLLWAGHVARMPKSRLPKRRMLSWVHEPRIGGGQEMTYGRSLERHLRHFGLVDDSGKAKKKSPSGGLRKAISFSEWATLAQDRIGHPL